MSNIVTELAISYSLREKHQLSVADFNTRTMKNSITYWGAVLWNIIASLSKRRFCQYGRQIA